LFLSNKSQINARVQCNVVVVVVAVAVVADASYYFFCHLRKKIVFVSRDQITGFIISP